MSDHPLRVREFEPVHAGETIPDKIPTKPAEPILEKAKQWFAPRTPPEQFTEQDNLAHLPQFEKLREKVNAAKGDVNNAKIASAQFESQVVDERRKFDEYVESERNRLQQNIEDAELRLGTLDDHAQQYIKSVWPEKMLVDDPNADITAPDLPTHTPIQSIEDPS